MIQYIYQYVSCVNYSNVFMLCSNDTYPIDDEYRHDDYRHEERRQPRRRYESRR